MERSFSSLPPPFSRTDTNYQAAMSIGTRVRGFSWLDGRCMPFLIILN